MCFVVRYNFTIVATNVLTSRPPEQGLTSTLTTCANLLFIIVQVSITFAGAPIEHTEDNEGWYDTDVMDFIIDIKYDHIYAIPKNPPRK